MVILISEKDFRAKQIIGDTQTLHNKRVNLLVRHNDPKCVCTKQQSLKTNEAKTERAKRRHRQIHVRVEDFNTSLSAIDATIRQNQR